MFPPELVYGGDNVVSLDAVKLVAGGELQVERPCPKLHLPVVVS